MKRLSQTWRQKAKTTEKTSIDVLRNNENQASRFTNIASTESQEETPRRSQRLAKSSSLKNDVKYVLQDIKVLCNKTTASSIEQKRSLSTPSSNGQCSFFNSSFGFEFDADTLSTVDKMEKKHIKEKREPLLATMVSPITPGIPQRDSLSLGTTYDKAQDMQSTPNERSCKKMGVERGHSVWPIDTILKTNKAVTKDKIPNKLKHDRQKSDLQAVQDKPNVTETCINRPMLNEASILQTEISTQTSLSSSQACLTQQQCELTSWGLPDNILEQYKKIGITTMFEWQAQCLRTGNVLNGGNLVYSAPTSAGKTMVAEILTLKRVLEMKCKALFILPFISVAREKMFYMQRMFGEAGIKVDGYMGSQAPTKGFDSIDIAVCTIEKANGLVNRLMEAGQLHSVGAIVVDEMHLIGDKSRGYLLELLLTKVLYMSQSAAGSQLERNVQIIGMSATLPNLNVLATWLRADLYFTNYRPVPLTETFKVGPVVYDRLGNVLRKLTQTRVISGDEDHVFTLCQETVEEGNGVLVFCPTKTWCEKLAESIAKHFYTLGSTKMAEAKVGRHDFVQSSSLVMFDYESLKDVFEQLRSCQVGLDNVLGKTLRYGVAYHHAGLTYDERDIIEAGFRQGIIKVLVATSTLSSGVNLPARRVIIRTPMFHGKLLDGLVYKQMSGRAGRKGVDSQGESILICKGNEKKKAMSLFEDDLKPVESCLVAQRSDEDEGNGIKRALLEIIASGVATTPADVQRYASCTFYVSSKGQEAGQSTQNIIENTVSFLEKNEFITLRMKEDGNGKTSDNSVYVPTQLGQATLASSLSPDEALVVFADLRKARRCFVLENELHILYQVTPIYLQDQWPNLDWYQYLRLWERLPSHMKRVADLIGVEERFLNRAIRGRGPARSEDQRHAHRVHKRFYVTMALHDLVHEVPLDTVAKKYGASRGMLQSLQSSAATFAGMVTIFCHKLGWNNLEMLLSQFQNRLTFGIERELCDLVRISTLNAFRARVLYGAGYHTVAAIAAASPAEVEKHLRNATPFQSKKKSEGESDYELRRRVRAKCVWVKGGKALTDAAAAQEIVKEAFALLKGDALKLGMTWKPQVAESGRQDSKTKTKEDVALNEKASVGNGDDNERVECSNDLQKCNATKTSTRAHLTNDKENLTKDHHAQDIGKERLSLGLSPQKLDKLRNQNTVASLRNEQARISEGPANTNEPNSPPCLAMINSAVSNNAVTASFSNQINKHRNIAKTKEVVASIPSTQCPSVSTSTAINSIITYPTNTTGSLISNSTCVTTHTVCSSWKFSPPASLRSDGTSDIQFSCQKISPKDSTLRKPLFKIQGNTPNNVVFSISELSNKKKLSSNSKLLGKGFSTNQDSPCNAETSMEMLKRADGKNRGTPRKTDRSLKRKHSVSKSPRDCNGPKMKPVGHDDHLTFTGKQEDIKETMFDSRSPQKLKSEISYRKDTFDDCSDNFNTKYDVDTPNKRKTTAVPLLESTRDSLRSPSKYASITLQQDKVRLTVAGKLSNSVKTPERKNMPAENPARDHFDMIEDKNKATGNKPLTATKLGFHNSISNEESNLFVGKSSLSNTKTPTGKQIEVQDESPELITSAESSATTTTSIVPFTEIVYKITSPKTSVITSPELYSEALFPDYDSPRLCDQSFEMQVDKMSESKGFDNVDPNLVDLEVSAKQKDDIISIKSNELTNSKMFVEVQTPEKVELNDDDKRPEATCVTEICTPGMFDSELVCSQLTAIPLDNSRPEITDQHSPEHPRRNSNQIQRTTDHPQGIPEQLPSSPKVSRPNSEHSRRSSDSFSLRLSQSFECTSDSDISTTTLATVAAMEEEERISKGNQNNEGCLINDGHDTNVSQGFGEFSNISLETMAIIEAMDDELGQKPGNHEVLRSHSNVEQGKVESSNACKTCVSHESCVSNGARLPSKSSSDSEKRFTEIKQRSLPYTHTVTTKAKTVISRVEKFDAKRLSKKGNIPSNLPFEIIDVAKDQNAFERFVTDCQRYSFSFSVAAEKHQPFTSNIGRKFNKRAKCSSMRENPRLAFEGESQVVVGIAVCWKDRYVHFLSLGEQTGESDMIEVPFEERLDSLQCIMKWHGDSHVKTAFAIKDQYKVLSQACGVILKGRLLDPKTANWLLDPGAKEKNFLQVVEHFLPQESDVLQGIIGGCGHANLGLAMQSSVSARERSCLDAVFTRMLMDRIRPMLEADGLWQAFTKIEMPVTSCLARMELNGFGFSNNECEQIKHILRAKLRALEKEAYRLAQRRFSLTSPDDVSRVLFLELKLPPDGHADMSTNPVKAVKPTRGGKRKVKYFSTSKDVLEKVGSLHPLPKVVLEWRRINSALTKVVFPVQKEQVNCEPPLNMSRIFPSALTHTATGRVTFVEPNLQNVPKDFNINLPTVIADTPPTENLADVSNRRPKGKVAQEIYTPSDDCEPCSPGPQFSVSLRSAFVPFSNGILLAADYSQLELRLVAHLSGDGKLVGFLNAGGDAFKMIASEIFHIAQEDVTDDQRQQAKHVCYGIIYGIGSKALGQTLGVDGNEAAAFIDAFKARFTGVRTYLKKTVDECRTNGYVTTISRRKRFLPNIRSSNAASRSQAERQAVNTTVQGSAADLVKLAMANIDRRMCEEFTNCWRTHRQKSGDDLASRSPRFGKGARQKKLRGANLVLQLHDELLFEVVEEDFFKVVQIVKDEMENAMKLSVKTPVKMKSGKSWGTMIPME